MSYEPTTDPAPPTPGAFTAEYFPNPNLTGPPVVTRTDSKIDFDWGFTGSPNPAVPSDLFSARWTRTTDYAAGTYHFTITGDDGIRLLVDGTPVLDGWSDHGPTTYEAHVSLTAGPHTIVVEYYERTGGAVARFTEAPM